MSMTVMVTRNVSPRTRGFLASIMLELMPGVYTASRLSPAVRGRIWDTLEEWFEHENKASIIMLWADPKRPCGQDVKVLGAPPIGLIEVDGIILSHRKLVEKPHNPDNL